MLFELPAMSILAQRYRLQQFSPVERLHETLLEIYREWNGNGVPNIAILDWKNLPTANEFILLRNHFTERALPQSSVRRTNWNTTATALWRF